VDHTAHNLVPIFSELSMLLQMQFQYLHIQCVILQTTVAAVCTTCLILCCGSTVFLCALCDFHNKVQVHRKAVSWCLECRLFLVVDPDPSILCA
jgi:hypothetical protein